MKYMNRASVYNHLRSGEHQMALRRLSENQNAREARSGRLAAAYTQREDDAPAFEMHQAASIPNMRAPGLSSSTEFDGGLFLPDITSLNDFGLPREEVERTRLEDHAELGRQQAEHADLFGERTSDDESESDREGIYYSTPYSRQTADEVDEAELPFEDDADDFEASVPSDDQWWPWPDKQVDLSTALLRHLVNTCAVMLASCPRQLSSAAIFSSPNAGDHMVCKTMWHRYANIQVFQVDAKPGEGAAGPSQIFDTACLTDWESLLGAGHPGFGRTSEILQ